jgi:pyrroline-5-carboxylate reductase
MERSLGFIGGGRAAAILIGGLSRAGRLPKRVVVSDPNQSSLEALKVRHPSIEIAVAYNARAAAQGIVLLGVHPPVMAGVAEEIRAALAADAIVLSLAPKVTMPRLAEMLGGFGRLARVIPNAPSIVGAGFNPVAFAPTLDGTARSEVLDLLGPLGDCPEVAEADLEPYAVLTAMGPTYLWFQLYELVALAESFGLSHAAATEGLERMVAGSLAIMARSGLTPAEVMDLVAVRPLGEDEAAITALYREKLPALLARLRP